MKDGTTTMMVAVAIKKSPVLLRGLTTVKKINKGKEKRWVLR